MGRAFFLQNNFTGGQVTPRLGMRVDLTRYKNGLAALENMTVMPQGGATSRLGFLHVNRAKYNDKRAHLIPFEVSTDVAYQIEAGEGYFRFYRDESQVRLTAQGITGITQADPAVVTYSGADTYSNGDPVYISGVVGMTEVNNREFTVANVNTGSNTFELLDLDSTGYTAYVSGGSVEEIYEIASPYDEDEVFELRYCQSADVLFLHHGNHAPRRLSRFSDTNWTVTTDTQVDGPYLDEDTSETTLTVSATSGTVTVTASAALFAATDTSGTGGTGDADRIIRVQDRDKAQSITAVTQASPAVVTYAGDDNYTNGDTVYISGIVGMTELNGRSFEIDNVVAGSNTFELKDIDSTGYTAYTSGGSVQTKRDKWNWLKITGYTSSTVVTAEIQDDATFGSVGPLSTFRLGAWSDTTGYPWIGTFFENRLIRFRTNLQNSKFWASALDNYTRYTPSTDDDEAYDFTLASNKLDAIQWVSSQRQLRVGTAGSEYSISGGTGSVTATNINVKRETENGSPFVEALAIRNSTIFLQRAGKKLREFTFSFDIDGFVDPDLSIGAEDIPRPRIDQIVHHKEPDGVVWMRLSTGELVGMTYLRDQDVVGWHVHPLGGSGTKIESLSVVPAEFQDRLWAVVSRTIDGETVRSIERMGDQFVDLTVNDGVFLDGAFSFTGGTPNSTLTPAATTGNGITFTAGSSVFTAADVGKEIRSGGGKAIITAQAGTTATADILLDFASTGSIASGDWTLSSDIITGINHLEGETISVLADGGVHPQVTVSGGSVTLDGQYTTVHLGIPYTQRVLSLNIEGGADIGTSQGSRGRATSLILRFFETVGAKFRGTNGPSHILDFRRPSDQQDEGVPLFTGEKEVKVGRGFADKIEIEVVQDQPLPMTLLGYVAKIEASNAP